VCQVHGSELSISGLEEGPYKLRVGGKVIPITVVAGMNGNFGEFLENLILL
jgi:hypothetical protein